MIKSLFNKLYLKNNSMGYDEGMDIGVGASELLQ